MSNEAIDWAIKQATKGGAARKLILLLLANRANDEWVCWPSRKLLAEEACIGLGQVGKHLQALEEEGLIRRVAWERADGGQGANCYVLGSADVTPYSFSSRGGGRIRVGGSSETSRGPTRKRAPMNPKGDPTANTTPSGPREETRGRSPADAVETHTQPRPTQQDLWQAINTTARTNPDAYQRQTDTIRTCAPSKWRKATDAATEQFREADSPHQHDQAQITLLAYKYVIQAYAPNWPAWLLGPLLPLVETTQADTTRAA